MKLDNKLLKEMIAEALNEVELSAGGTHSEVVEEEAESKEDELEETESVEVPKVTSTMEESFQLTKGRLRQIIREELIRAKKQGLL